MKRGEVWWADLPPPAGRRPVLLLSRDRAYRVRSAVTVAPLAKTVRGIPVEVPVGPEHGLPTTCAVNLDDLMTIPKSLLAGRLCTLEASFMDEVAAAVRFALDLG